MGVSGDVFASSSGTNAAANGNNLRNSQTVGVHPPVARVVHALADRTLELCPPQPATLWKKLFRPPTHDIMWDKLNTYNEADDPDHLDDKSQFLLENSENYDREKERWFSAVSERTYPPLTPNPLVTDSNTLARDLSLPSSAPLAPPSSSAPVSVGGVSKFTVSVGVLRGKVYHKQDLFGLGDPYVVVKIGKKEQRTHVIKNTLDPKWNVEFSFPDASSADVQDISLALWDKDPKTDDLIGVAHLSLLECMHEDRYLNKYSHVVVPVLDEKYKETGNVELDIMLCPSK